MAADPWAEFADAPEADPLESARQQYPYLRRAKIQGVRSQPKAGDKRLLEYWPAGEPGDEKTPRPAAIPLDSPGIEILSDEVNPSDVLADYASHEGVRSDPKLKSMYEEFAAMVPESTMRKRYLEHRQKFGEKRAYKDWKQSTGMPELFRGYTFNQWDNAERYYTPQQLAKLDEVRSYLGVDAPAADESTGGGDPWVEFQDAAETAPAAQRQQQEAYDPSAGGGELRPFGIETGIKTPEVFDRFLAGAGKAFSDVGRGAKQLAVQAGEATGVIKPDLSSLVTGQDETQRLQAEEAERRRLDAPLMDTAAGKVGNITGGVAAAAPALAIPGANTVVGAGLIGAGYGALQPTVSNQERLTNTAVGGAAGSVGQAIGQKVSQYATRKIAERSANAASQEAQNAVRDATLKEARAVGYKVPPATTNPTAKNRALESVSGKAATQQSAAVKNQAVTNRLAREELGMAKDAPITKAALNAIRSKEGQVYKAVKAAGRISADDQYLDDLAKIGESVDEVAKDFPDLDLGAHKEINRLVDGLLKDSFDSSSAVELVKNLRHEASSNLSFAASADPSKKTLGLAQREAAATVEDLLIRHLETSGKRALGARFDKARQLIAKTYSVEGALNEGSGNVVAAKLATQLKKGKPLSGRLQLAAKFAQAFPKAAEEVKTSPGVSAVDALVGGVGGLTVNPALAALPLGRIATREALLSKAGQSLAKPSYAPGKIGTSTLEALKQGKRAALPSVVYATQQ